MKTIRLSSDDQHEITWALFKEQERLENSMSIQFSVGDAAAFRDRARSFEHVTRLRMRVNRRPRARA